MDRRNTKIPKNNTSGYRGISWYKRNKLWVFKMYIDGKLKHIKQMKNLDDLIAFAEQWKNEHN